MMFDWLMKLWQFVRRWQHEPRVIEPEEREATVEVRPEPRPEVASNIQAFPTQTKLDVFEKNRRKHDKFLVIPKGKGTARKNHKPPAVEAPAPPPPILPSELTIVQDTKSGEQVAIKESEMWGEFNFRDTILDQLDRYFFYIKRMRQRDKDAYDLYRQIGATLLPYASLSHDRLDKQFLGRYDDVRETGPQGVAMLPPFFREKLPTFGCYAYATDPLSEEVEQEPEKKGKVKWVPKFLYFLKYASPPAEIQASSGIIVYKITVWWDRPFGGKKFSGGVPNDYAVAVMADGSIHALKILKPVPVEIHGKRRHPDPNSGRIIRFSRNTWHIPRYFTLNKGESQERALEHLFANIARWHEGVAMSNFRIAVKNGRHSATFAVNALRAPYFFADRDLAVDEGGRKRRIFHIVRPHRRQMPNGKELFVKGHHRGLRKFKWAGYDVLITVPGLHHFDIAAFNAPSHDAEHLGKDKIDMNQIGTWLSSEIEGHPVKPWKEEKPLSGSHPG